MLGQGSGVDSCKGQEPKGSKGVKWFKGFDQVPAVSSVSNYMPMFICLIFNIMCVRFIEISSQSRNSPPELVWTPVSAGRSRA